MMKHPIKRFCAIALAAAMVSASALPAAADTAFSDVAMDDWFYSYVITASEKGLMNGVGDGCFDPNGVLTREQFVTVLAQLAGADLSSQGNGSISQVFSDVPADEWYAPYINWAYENGFASGYGDGTFGVGDSVTREQMAQFIANYCIMAEVALPYYATESFVDADSVSSWAEYAVELCHVSRIFDGDEAGKMNPQSSINRAEAATVFCSLWELLHATDEPADDHVHCYTAEETLAATCGTFGICTYTCVCGAVYQEVIPATGLHTWAERFHTVHHDEVGHEEESGHYEQVEIGTEQWIVCNKCGYREQQTEDGISDTMQQHLNEVCLSGYTSESNPVYENQWVSDGTRWVVDEPAYDESVSVGQLCTVCGATK